MSRTTATAPKQISKTISEHPFWLEVLLSAAGHVLVVAIIFLRILLVPQSDDLNLESAMRVDIVGLPEKPRPNAPVVETPAAKPPPEVKTPEKPATPPKTLESAKDTPVVIPDAKADAKKLKKDQAEALRRLEALGKIDQDLKAEEAKKRKAENEARVKGNRLSPGDSLSGVDRLQMDSYIRQIDSHVKSHWYLTPILAQMKLRARALVLIDENGNILARKITHTSNNSEFDDKVLEAIDKSAPFPPPPDRYTNLMRIKGVEFAFPE